MSQKKEFVLEYDFQSSPQLLFQYLSTLAYLSGFLMMLIIEEKSTLFFGEIQKNMLEFYPKKLMRKLGFNG